MLSEDLSLALSIGLFLLGSDEFIVPHACFLFFFLQGIGIDGPTPIGPEGKQKVKFWNNDRNEIEITT